MTSAQNHQERHIQYVHVYQAGLSDRIWFMNHLLGLAEFHNATIHFPGGNNAATQLSKKHSAKISNWDRYFDVPAMKGRFFNEVDNRLHCKVINNEDADLKTIFDDGSTCVTITPKLSSMKSCRTILPSKMLSPSQEVLNTARMARSSLPWSYAALHIRRCDLVGAYTANGVYTPDRSGQGTTSACTAVKGIQKFIEQHPQEESWVMLLYAEKGYREYLQTELNHQIPNKKFFWDDDLNLNPNNDGDNYFKYMVTRTLVQSAKVVGDTGAGSRCHDGKIPELPSHDDNDIQIPGFSLPGFSLARMDDTYGRVGETCGGAPEFQAKGGQTRAGFARTNEESNRNSIDEESNMWDSLEQSEPDKPLADFARTKTSGFDWYPTLKPIDASAPNPANRLLTRKMMCIKGQGFQGGEGGQQEAKALKNAFQVTDIPANYKGEIIKGAVLITTVHHFDNYIFRNIGHMSSSAYAIYDALDALKDHHNGNLPVDITTVLMHQANEDTVENTDWHKRVAQLIAHGQGLKTRYLKRPDLQKGFCAEQVVIYDRPDYNERHFFTSPSHANAFQEHAIDSFGLPVELKANVRSPSRVVNMVIRRDDQGYRNWKDINEKTKAYLATRCWSMIEFVPGSAKSMKLKDQVEAFAKGDLSISVHGAHFQNLVWQARKTGAIIIEKKDFEDSDVCQLATNMGISFYKAGPQQVKDQNRTKLCRDMHLPTFKPALKERVQWSPILDAVMDLNFETELKPVLAQAIDELEKNAFRGPPCGVQKKMEEIGLWK